MKKISRMPDFLIKHVVPQARLINQNAPQPDYLTET
jgi:hypothetical protein